MGNNSETRASFYKFLTNDDFTSRLRIPTEFVRNYGDLLPPKKTTLRTDQPGKSWRVRIEQLGQRHFFTHGWPDFAKDNDLKFQEFVLFKLVDASAFHVSVYQATGCKKDSYPGTRDRTEIEGPGNSQLKVKSEHFPDQENGSSAVRSWKFSKELTESSLKDRLSIPKDFAIGTGIARNRKIRLVDGQGREWPVKVTDRNLGMFALTAGWRNFLAGNKVVVGSTMLFEFIPGSDNVIEVRVLKNEARDEQSYLPHCSNS
ncbi:hypothetical protein Salat_2451100 [Sesamum alatum]|uniref:TF-B3 domain-containing protein n=1 Tax=Sesamum alatum TaxID=300844 RepID=A0AAE2CBR6_9LAMI|nr:hypothetical protein Salat_2451100 [Sesamum alatum]